MQHINITSDSNRAILIAASLNQKKYRDMYGYYLIEGRRAVFDALSSGADVVHIFVTGKFSADFNETGEGLQVYEITDRLMEKVCNTQHPQGIAAVVKQSNFTADRVSGNCLVLDGISDPGNMGTIIRTAAACGFYEIFAINCVDVYNPKSVRASMGGINFVKVYDRYSANEAAEILKKSNVQIFCTGMDGVNLFEVTPEKGKFKAVIIGSEAAGVSDFLRGISDVAVTIPMKNVESLNAAVSAGVAMYSLGKE